MKVSFIGLGIMGSRMAANLVKKNIDLRVYNRTISKADYLKELGAKVSDNYEDAVKDADIVITMLGSPKIVDDLKGDFLPKMKNNAIWIDSSTVGPDDSKRSAESAKSHGIRFLEAPVAGTKQPAEAGGLVFFVGGSEEDKNEVDHLFDIMGQKNIYMGEHGKAASIKILVNLMLAQSMLAYSEAMKLAKGMGLNEQLTSTILTNAPVSAPFLQKVKARVDNNIEETNFPLQWMSKDLGLVMEMAEKLNLKLDSTNIANRIYEEAKEKGYAENDFSSIYSFLN